MGKRARKKEDDDDDEEEVARSRAYLIICNVRAWDFSSMAVFDFFENMHDTRLKPRLLKSLIKDRLPDEKHPFSSPSELSAVVSTVKNHALLSESFPESCDPKLVESWNSTVDIWVEHLLSLISSKMVVPDVDLPFVNIFLF